MAEKHTGETQRDEHAIISGVAGKKVFNVDSSGNIIDFGSTKGSTATYSNATIVNTATQIVASDTSRRSVIVQNISNATVFVGTDNGVTSSNGIRLIQDDALVLDNYDGAVFGIADATGHPIRFISELD